MAAASRTHNLDAERITSIYPRSASSLARSEERDRPSDRATSTDLTFLSAGPAGGTERLAGADHDQYLHPAARTGAVASPQC